MDSYFENLEIVKYLRENDPILYGKIQIVYIFSRNILTQVPCVFNNYTLHDIQHSIRVAGYMNEFVKENLDKYSNLHLAIIIFVALLHDTGMIVTQDEKELLYDEFKNKDSSFSSLSDEKKSIYLQNHIRKFHGDRIKYIMNNKTCEEQTLNSIFCVGETGSYNISQIIIDICRSHTHDVSWIINNIRPSYCFGTDNIMPVHIAFLLRIADALDIDDRRAPFALYDILNPEGISDLEWNKHIPITNYEKITKDQTTEQFIVSFLGRCDKPIVYRTIKEYIEWIKYDIENIVEKSSEFDELYKINIRLPITVQIETQGFTQDELRFSLEYRQISSLLMGEKIYGDKKHGMRELIQNAMDAVLLMKDIESQKRYTAFDPVVGLEFDKKKNEIIIFDNGIGMNENVLEKYFFNIGNSFYRSTDFKDCNQNYVPIGHFGIGFLACFMLSSNVRIETKHYVSGELITLELQKESFYITRMICSDSSFEFEHGTKVVLDYSQVIPKIFENEESIINYIQSNILTDSFNFWIINGTRSSIDSSFNSIKASFKDAQLFYNYLIKENPNVLFNVFEYFGRIDNAYLVDEDLINDNYEPENGFYTLAFLKEELSSIDYKIDSHLITEKQISNCFDELPFILQKIFEFDSNNLWKWHFENSGLVEYLNKHLINTIKSNNYTFYKIPFIRSQRAFNNFLNYSQRHGEEAAYKKFRDSFETINVICKHDISRLDKLVIDLITDALAYYNDYYSDDELAIDYFQYYPLKLSSKVLRLMYSPEHDCYIRILENYTKFSPRIYLNGIKISKGIQSLPYVIDGLNITEINANVISNSIETDVSRSQYNTLSENKLIAYLIRSIYNNYVSCNDLSPAEAALINQFLDHYYRL